MRSSTVNFAGVLGWPLTHTLSPVINNAAFRSLRLDWIYLRWPVSPDALGDALRGLRALGAIGANVTMPHKETVIEHLDEVADEARAIGAVNTIQRFGDRLIGHNTDVAGFARFLVDDAGIDPKGARVLVLGAGGAARAVVKALSGLGAAEIDIASRRREAADELLSLPMGPGARSVAWSDAPEAAAHANVIVNATPVGMLGEDPLGGARLRSDQCVVDLIYSPPSTPLVERARAAGAAAWGGLGMLVDQAAESIRIWTGQDPPLQTMSAAAVRAIGGHGG